MSEDFDIKYRPRKLSEVVGQDAAVKTIKGFKGKLPRVIMFHGQSGAGKTTLARILTNEVQGLSLKSIDFYEANCASWDKPLDQTREIEGRLNLLPVKSGTKRTFILDEVQSLTRAGASQQALLKILEECPDHCQFYLCTTDPEKLQKAVRNRCVEIAIKPLKEKDAEELARRIAKAESMFVSDEVISRVASICDGAARSVCKYMQKIAAFTSEDEQLEVLGRGFGDDKSDEFALARALLYSGGNPTWPAISKVLTDLQEKSPETLRCITIAAARTTLLKGGPLANLAYRVIRCLEQPLYEGGPGKALLAANCFEICNAKK